MITHDQRVRIGPQIVLPPMGRGRIRAKVELNIMSRGEPLNAMA